MENIKLSNLTNLEKFNKKQNLVNRNAHYASVFFGPLLHEHFGEDLKDKKLYILFDKFTNPYLVVENNSKTTKTSELVMYRIDNTKTKLEEFFKSGTLEFNLKQNNLVNVSELDMIRIFNLNNRSLGSELFDLYENISYKQGCNSIIGTAVAFTNDIDLPHLINFYKQKGFKHKEIENEPNKRFIVKSLNNYIPENYNQRFKTLNQNDIEFTVVLPKDIALEINSESELSQDKVK